MIMRIKDMAKVDRPREKLIKYGINKLSNVELLAIILGSGIKGKSSLELAKKIIKKFSFAKLTKVNYHDLHLSGIGLVKSCQIIAAIELGKRIAKNKKSKLFLTPKNVWEEMKDLRDNKKEYFVIFYLDVKNEVINREIISIGILNANLVHPREVFEPAVRFSAAQIILSHNHPSGQATPSEDDKLLTKRLIEAGKILGIEIIDHVVVTKENYFSFKKNNIC